MEVPRYKSVTFEGDAFISYEIMKICKYLLPINKKFDFDKLNKTKINI